MEIAILILVGLIFAEMTYALFLSGKVEQAKLIALHLQKEQELEVLRAGLREAQVKLSEKARKKGRQ